MMAFFLLMWLLNATTEEQRRGIADYFSPTQPVWRGPTSPAMARCSAGARPTATVARRRTRRGAGAGRAADADPDAEDDDTGDSRPAEPPHAGHRPSACRARATVAPAPGTKPAEAAARANGNCRRTPSTLRRRTPRQTDIAAELERRETRDIRARRASRSATPSPADPALADLARQLMIDVTPEGLRVQLLDAERQPMFSTGSAALERPGAGRAVPRSRRCCSSCRSRSRSPGTPTRRRTAARPHQLGPVGRPRQRDAPAAGGCRAAGNPDPQRRRHCRPRPAGRRRPARRRQPPHRHRACLRASRPRLPTATAEAGRRMLTIGGLVSCWPACSAATSCPAAASSR